MSPNGPKVAVCGGAIKLVRSDGSAQLYGMLAGHSVFDVDSLDSSDDLVANSREENLAPRTKEVNEDKRPAGQSDHGRQLGQVTVKGYGGIRNSTPDYDWALFEFSSGLMVLPSMYLGGTPVDVSYVGTNVGRFSRYISDQEVEIVGGNGLSRPGSLSNVPTRILLGLAEIATPVFTLTLREGEGEP
ncbi:hypothetical protein CkaCkLH20_00951 [Colletotrichum karsti]|uniref:Uncharacterized protein n=1 Tax=Colletotrichum karsti TaxID=1095194 RepID=A0A9P6LQ63_9PEZI|nr:uncharacterized protein CkaCkLH20_00951 [Colletotrichum karsti]KAF9881805.1 hypothetical protein CkaCkLH20_00951 [Colletotrichum karsti]